jgi:hypothetical protein
MKFIRKPLWNHARASGSSVRRGHRKIAAQVFSAKALRKRAIDFQRDQPAVNRSPALVRCQMQDKPPHSAPDKHD